LRRRLSWFCLWVHRRHVAQISFARSRGFNCGWGGLVRLPVVEVKPACACSNSRKRASAAA
jgi:hypothetical protein